MDLELRQLPHPHWVANLDRADDTLWALRESSPADSLWSVTVTDSEVSVVSTHQTLPHQVNSEGPWAVFEVAGPLDFSLVGILHSLTGPLKEAGIPVFVISSFDTDYLLVPQPHVLDAVACWREGGVGVSVSTQLP